MSIFSLFLMLIFLNFFASLLFFDCDLWDCFSVPFAWIFSFSGASLLILLTYYFFGIINPEIEKTFPAQQTPLQSQESLFHVNYRPVLGRFLQISTGILVLHELYFMVTEGILQGLIPTFSNSYSPLLFFSSLILFMIIFVSIALVLYHIFCLGSLFLEPEEKIITYRKTVVAAALFLLFLDFIMMTDPITSLFSSSTILFSTASLSSLFDIFGSLLYIICSAILCYYYMKNGE